MLQATTPWRNSVYVATISASRREKREYVAPDNLARICFGLGETDQDLLSRMNFPQTSANS